jgi:hypothetical protein
MPTNLTPFKLGLGTMSPEIVDLCLEYSAVNNYPIMLIASRNQADVDSGYAFTTATLAEQIRNNPNYNSERVLVCRDHCGPYFSDLDKGETLQHATGRCIETIITDSELGFDLIHIDVSKVDPKQQERVATTLFGVAQSANPNMMFEYGCEDNTGEVLNDNLKSMRAQLTLLNKYKPHVKFFVSQTGSLTKHTQVGKFNNVIARISTDMAHGEDLLFKEHNADYLTHSHIVKRKAAGVDAMNIAPQLGCLQTKVMHDLGKDLGAVYDEFRAHVLAKEYWVRWTTPDITDEQTRFIAGGHYSFNSIQGIALKAAIGDSLTSHLKPAIFAVLDEYRSGMDYKFA